MKEAPFLEKYAAARKAFQDGTIWTDDDEHLKEYIEGLATNKNANELIRHADIIKGMAINHIQTKRLIESINERNKSTTRWFMVLAIGSLLIGTTGLLWQISKDIQESQETDQSKSAVLETSAQADLPAKEEKVALPESKPTQTSPSK